MKYVLFYEAAPDVESKAPAHYAAHSARAQEFHARGVLAMIGVFTDTRNDGAMGVFTSRHDAETFAQDDPFVVNGVVSEWRVCEWMEVLSDQ